MAFNPHLTPTILVVEDDASVRQVLQRLLSRMRLARKVIAVENGAAALAEIVQHPVVLAIIDYRMPGIDGLQLTTAIKAISPTTRVVVVSALDVADLPERAGAAGADVFLAKPFTVEELQMAVEARR
jgi:CheY-like chemotaxis protein